MIAAAEMGDGGLKRKEAAASEGADHLKSNEAAMANLVGLFMANSMAESRLSGVGRTEPVPSGAGDDRDRDLEMKEARPCEEEGRILRLKKEAAAALDLWVDKFDPGALDRWLERKAKPEEEAQVPGVCKKRKKVVKSKLPKAFVDYIAADPYTVLPDMSDEELATSTPAFRQMYAIAKIVEDKTREYHRALIDQQQKFGYAEDEFEVTDDEFEVVKN